MPVTLSDSDFEKIYEAIKMYNTMYDDSQIESSIELLEEAWDVLQNYESFLPVQK
jgi:hypothetical protein